MHWKMGRGEGGGEGEICCDSSFPQIINWEF